MNIGIFPLCELEPLHAVLAPATNQREVFLRPVGRCFEGLLTRTRRRTIVTTRAKRKSARSSAGRDEGVHSRPPSLRL